MKLSVILTATKLVEQALPRSLPCLNVCHRKQIRVIIWMANYRKDSFTCARGRVLLLSKQKSATRTVCDKVDSFLRHVLFHAIIHQSLKVYWERTYWGGQGSRAGHPPPCSCQPKFIRNSESVSTKPAICTELPLLLPWGIPGYAPVFQ